PFAADESILDLAELEARHHHFDVINIKLDKCGGLSEGLAMARRARELGRQVMVGNMAGTSLAMAPAFVLGQHCDVVDLDGAVVGSMPGTSPALGPCDVLGQRCGVAALDGPVFLTRDRTPSVRCADGHIVCGEEVWGAAAAPCAPQPNAPGSASRAG